MGIQRRLTIGVMAVLLAAAPARAEETPPAGAAEGAPAARPQPEQTPAQGRGPVYGRDLMTEEEAARQRERMRAAKTEEERARIRAEHHAEMQKRAAERGLELAPPGSGPGRGGAGGPGAGRGRGPGGPGPGRVGPAGP